MFLRDLKEMSKVQLPSGISLRSCSILFDRKGKRTKAFRSFSPQKLRQTAASGPRMDKKAAAYESVLLGWALCLIWQGGQVERINSACLLSTVQWQTHI